MSRSSATVRADVAFLMGQVRGNIERNQLKLHLSKVHWYIDNEPSVMKLMWHFQYVCSLPPLLDHCT